MVLDYTDVLEHTLSVIFNCDLILETMESQGTTLKLVNVLLMLDQSLRNIEADITEYFGGYIWMFN